MELSAHRIAALRFRTATICHELRTIALRPAIFGVADLTIDRGVFLLLG
jgi:hypothetical protein